METIILSQFLVILICFVIIINKKSLIEMKDNEIKKINCYVKSPYGYLAEVMLNKKEEIITKLSKDEREGISDESIFNKH